MSAIDRLSGALNLQPDEVTSLLARLAENLEASGEYDQGDTWVGSYDDVWDLLGIARILWEAEGCRRLAADCPLTKASQSHPAHEWRYGSAGASEPRSCPGLAAGDGRLNA